MADFTDSLKKSALGQYANAMNRDSDYSRMVDEAVSGKIQSDANLGEDFKRNAKPLSKSEEAFMKEMKGADVARYVGEKPHISAARMEQMDDLKSYGQMHPAVEAEYNKVMNNPAAFGLKVEKDDIGETMNKMVRGADRGFDFSNM